MKRNPENPTPQKEEQAFSYHDLIEINIMDSEGNTPTILFNITNTYEFSGNDKKVFSTKIDGFHATLTSENNKIQKITLKSHHTKGKELSCTAIAGAQIIEISGQNLKFEGKKEMDIYPTNFRDYKTKLAYLEEAKQEYDKACNQVYYANFLRYVGYPFSITLPICLDSIMAYCAPNLICRTLSYISIQFKDQYDKRPDVDVCNSTAYFMFGTIGIAILTPKLFELAGTAINWIKTEATSLSYKDYSMSLIKRAYEDLCKETMSQESVPSWSSSKNQLETLIKNRFTNASAIKF